MAKVALVKVERTWRDCQELVVATLLRGARGDRGEIVRVTAPVEMEADAKWRVACEGMDRGFEVREAPTSGFLSHLLTPGSKLRRAMGGE